MTHNPPVVVELPWWPKPPRRGQHREPLPREPLSREQIVRGAVRLIDAQGLDALSMRRLGQFLGAGAASLYTYVRSRDELIDLVCDTIVGEVLDELASDPTRPWREQAGEFPRAVRRVLSRRHPHAAPLFARPGAGPNALLVVEAMLGVLRRAGFEGRQLVLAYTVILNHGYTYAAAEAVALGSSADGGAEQARAMAEALATSLPPETFPNIVSAAPAMAELTTDDQFEFGLQRLLDGLEILLHGER